MQYLLKQAGEEPKFLVEEVNSLIGERPVHVFGKFFTVNSKNDQLIRRLAYVSRISKIIDTVEKPDLTKYQKMIKGTYKLAFDTLKSKTLILSQAKLLTNKVDLKTPDNTIIITYKDQCIISSDIPLLRPDYSKRRNHFLPCPSPVSLYPRLARFSINLLGIRKGTVVDPMCGTGAFLIEAAICGLNHKGYDISDRMVNSIKQFFQRGFKRI